MIKRIAVFLAAASLLLVGCTANQEGQAAGANLRKEQAGLSIALERMLDSQPVPVWDWSQERETLRDVLAIRATGSTTTTMFLLNGVGMLFWCPSIGSSVPETTQLTAPEQYVRLPHSGGGYGNYAAGQMEPTGAYVGDTEGTWTVCLDDEGKKFGVRWEAPVSTIGGTLQLDENLRIKPDDITYVFGEEDRGEAEVVVPEEVEDE